MPVEMLSANRLTAVQIDALVDGRRPDTYPTNAIIYTQGEKEDRFYYLVSGLVKWTFFDREGKEKLLGIIRPGRFFGLPGPFTDRPQGITTITLCTSRVHAIRLGEVDRWLRIDPALTYALISSMADALWLMGRQICSMAFQDAHGAVATALVDALRQEPGGLAAQRDGVVRLTQSEMGAMTGLSRATVSRVLQSFRADGFIQIQRGSIRVQDLRALQSLTAI